MPVTIKFVVGHARFTHYIDDDLDPLAAPPCAVGIAYEFSHYRRRVLRARPAVGFSRPWTARGSGPVQRRVDCKKRPACMRRALHIHSD